MKVFKHVCMTVEEVERSLAEASLVSRLGHPNIIRVFEANVATTDAGEIGDFTMEYLPGGTLSAYRRSFGKGSMPVEAAVEVICQVCCALSVAHASKPPIIHSDVKPLNILIGYDAERPRAWQVCVRSARIRERSHSEGTMLVCGIMHYTYAGKAWFQSATGIPPLTSAYSCSVRQRLPRAHRKHYDLLQMGSWVKKSGKGFQESGCATDKKHLRKTRHDEEQTKEHVSPSVLPTGSGTISSAAKSV